MGNSSQDLQSRLQALRNDFLAQLPERLTAIEQAWQSHPRAGSEDLRELYRKVHSLTGAAGTFGLPALSEQARRIENRLRTVLQDGSRMTADFQAEVDADIVRLRQLIAAASADLLPLSPPASIATTSNSVAPTHEPDGGGAAVPDPAVYLLEEDVESSARLEGKLAPFGYRVRVFHDRGELFAAVEQERPLALIMDFRTPEVQAACTARLAEYQRRHGAGLPVIFIARDTGFEVRLQAARAGCYAYLEQPVDISLLVERLHALRADQAAEPYRVVIVEDDALLAEHYAKVLSEAGVRVRVLLEPARAIEALADFQPDVLLLDLHLTRCDGRDLAWLIRQDPAVLSMPIVFLSAETDPEVQYGALMMGADDFITKPIRDQQLVAVVRSRAQRARVLQDAMSRDSLTGLLKHTKIAEQLQFECARVRRHAMPLSFSMIDIDHFKRINDTYGHPVGDRVIRGLSQLLRQRLRTTDSIGRYGGEEFAVVLPETDSAGATALLEDLRQGFSALEFEAGDESFRVTFSAGVATSTAPTPADIAEAADRALYAAKRDGRNRVVSVVE